MFSAMSRIEGSQLAGFNNKKALARPREVGAPSPVLSLVPSLVLSLVLSFSGDISSALSNVLSMVHSLVLSLVSTREPILTMP